MCSSDLIVICFVGKQDEHPVRKLLGQLKLADRIEHPDLKALGPVKPVRVDAKREPVVEQPQTHAPAKPRRKRRRRKVGA